MRSVVHRYAAAMPNPDAEKQERLLRLAGWLHHHHNRQTIVPGTAYTEVSFTRRDFDDVPELAAYATSAGAAGERAILRDAGALREFGLTLDWDPTHQRWVSRATLFTPEERHALATAGLAVILEEARPENRIGTTTGEAITAGGASIVIDFIGELDTTIAAIRSRTCLAITHRGRARTVEPWSIAFRDGRWYLIGRDSEHREARVFSFLGIEALAATGDPGAFTIPSQEARPLATGAGDPERGSDDPPVEVVVAVDPRLAARAADLLGAEISGTTAGARVEMRCTIRRRDVFIGRLLGLRARAEVLAPDDVRQAVIAHLREMA